MGMRRIEWVPGARKAYNAFPPDVQDEIQEALRSIAFGANPDYAKPMQGLGSGVFEIAVRHRKDAWRVVYALKLGDEIWIIHAFQKKSKSGIATPKAEIDTIKERLKRLRTTS